MAGRGRRTSPPPTDLSGLPSVVRSSGPGRGTAGSNYSVLGTRNVDIGRSGSGGAPRDGDLAGRARNAPGRAKGQNLPKGRSRGTLVRPCRTRGARAGIGAGSASATLPWGGLPLRAACAGHHPRRSWLAGARHAPFGTGCHTRFTPLKGPDCRIRAVSLITPANLALVAYAQFPCGDRRLTLSDDLEPTHAARPSLPPCVGWDSVCASLEVLSQRRSGAILKVQRVPSAHCGIPGNRLGLPAYRIPEKAPPRRGFFFSTSAPGSGATSFRSPTCHSPNRAA